MHSTAGVTASGRGHSPLAWPGPVQTPRCLLTHGTKLMKPTAVGGQQPGDEGSSTNKLKRPRESRRTETRLTKRRPFEDKVLMGTAPLPF